MISEFLKSEIFLMAVATINIILLILYIVYFHKNEPKCFND